MIADKAPYRGCGFQPQSWNVGERRNAEPSLNRISLKWQRSMRSLRFLTKIMSKD